MEIQERQLKMISVTFPTKNRPESFMRMIASAIETADTNVEFCVYMDDDDLSYEHLDLENINIKIKKGKEKILSVMYNEAYSIATNNIIMQAGDDLIFRTKHWDTKVLKVFEKVKDKILIAYGDDGILGARLTTHGFISRKWIEKSGFFCPPYFRSDFNDKWLDEIGNRINRRYYIPSLYIEHMHFVLGKSEKDKTYLDRLVKHDEDNVETIYDEKLPERINQANTLRKEILKTFSTRFLFYKNSILQSVFTTLHDLRLKYHFVSKNNKLTSKLIYKLLSIKISS